MTASDRFHGLLIVDKPAGWTSHDVVGRIRRIAGQRSVGHAGTLDPAATGVLPVALGSALRALEFLAGASKSYQAEITFGVTTDALDIDGRLTEACGPPDLSIDQMKILLASFNGTSEQVPPVFSAIKIDGTPLYERARRGDAVEAPMRSVTIHSIDLLSWEPPVLTVDIACSKGFYVRSFARDLGERARSCAYLSNLVRTRVADFDLCDAWTLEELALAPLADEWQLIALAPDATAFSLPAVLLDNGRVIDWHHGKRWELDDVSISGPVRVYDSAGAWLGIGEVVTTLDSSVLHPRKVIPTLATTAREPR